MFTKFSHQVFTKCSQSVCSQTFPSQNAGLSGDTLYMEKSLCRFCANYCVMQAAKIRRKFPNDFSCIKSSPSHRPLDKVWTENRQSMETLFSCRRPKLPTTSIMACRASQRPPSGILYCWKVRRPRTNCQHNNYHTPRNKHYAPCDKHDPPRNKYYAPMALNFLCPLLSAIHETDSGGGGRNCFRYLRRHSIRDHSRLSDTFCRKSRMRL